MLNNVILIGRLVEKPILKNLDDGLKVSNFVLAVTRPFKNQAGEYETDFIPASLWYANASNVYQYCDKGDAICVKGRLTHKIQEIDGKNYSFLEMIGEKLIFLNNKSYYENKSGKQEVEETTIENN